MTVLDLRQYLMERRICDVQVLNIGEGRAVKNGESLCVNGHWDFFHKVMSFARKGYLIHLETNGHNFKSWLSAFVCTAAGCLNGRKTIIAFGSGNLPSYLRQVRGCRRIVAKLVLALAGVVICRNQNMVDAIQKIHDGQKRIEIVPGFMGLHTRKPADVSKPFEEFCRTHTPLVGATVKLEPEYGVVLALQVMQRLLKEHSKLGLVLLGIGPDATEQLSELTAVRGHVHLAGEVDANVALSMMRRLDLFLRPTYFDGDSLSVREALALGIPVVASDTGLRPNGVVLFETGVADDLEKKLNYAMRHRDEVIQRQRNGSKTEGSVDLMMRIYRRLAVGDIRAMDAVI